MWAPVPAARVALGLSVDERERLTDVLVTIDRAEFERTESVRYSEYDPSKRRAEIAAGLETASGHVEVDVAAYQIMRTPVTNKMWVEYMKATGAPRPAAWPPGAPPIPSDPVAGVSHTEASTFASFYGWSLPSEAEWELAATGGDCRWFPWGSSPPNDDPSFVSPIGVEQIAEGSSEYTSDHFGPYGHRIEVGAQVCLRGNAPKVPPCIPARRGLAADHRFKFARFRCVRRR
jgi:hypothetical protein